MLTNHSPSRLVVLLPTRGHDRRVDLRIGRRAGLEADGLLHEVAEDELAAELEAANAGLGGGRVVDGGGHRRGGDGGGDGGLVVVVGAAVEAAEVEGRRRVVALGGIGADLRKGCGLRRRGGLRCRRLGSGGGRFWGWC